jgi:tripeptide aminopeptidase
MEDEDNEQKDEVEFLENQNKPLSKKRSYSISPEITQVYESILSDPNVQIGLSFIKADSGNTLADQIEISGISAPTFQEHARGAYFKTCLEQLGLEDIHTNEIGNVSGVRRGRGNGPKLMVSAHLDTVFPEGTDLKVREVNGRYIGPGIADDSRGLATLLSLARAFRETGIETEGDLVFCSTVGEEGLGGFRGAKAVFQEGHDLDGFITIEPGQPTRTTYMAMGARRYSITYKGPGGHANSAFGTPSATHALGRAIAQISDVKPPASPRTTFTVAVISGGTAVNAIASEATMSIDMRSSSNEELAKLEMRFIAIFHEAAEAENKRWNKSDDIKLEITMLNSRPAGAQSPNDPIVQAALASAEAIGFTPLLSGPGNTDANVPITLGIPALALGGGGDNGRAHTLEEWYDPTDAHYGVQKIFLTLIGLVGIFNKTAPLLPKRK